MDVEEIVKYPDGKINCPCCGLLTYLASNRAKRFIASLKAANARMEMSQALSKIIDVNGNEIGDVHSPEFDELAKKCEQAEAEYAAFCGKEVKS